MVMFSSIFSKGNGTGTVVISVIIFLSLSLSLDAFILYELLCLIILLFIISILGTFIRIFLAYLFNNTLEKKFN